MPAKTNSKSFLKPRTLYIYFSHARKIVEFFEQENEGFEIDEVLNFDLVPPGVSGIRETLHHGSRGNQCPFCKDCSGRLCQDGGNAPISPVHQSQGEKNWDSSQVLEAKAHLKKLDKETAKLISEYADLIDEMDAKKKEESKKPEGLEPGTLSGGAGLEKPLVKHNTQKISAEHRQICIDALYDAKHMPSLKKSKI